MHRRLARAAAAALLLCLSCSLPGLAAYPDRPVRIVVSYPAGGQADLPVRVIAEGLAKKFNQSFVIENRPAVGGVIGTEAVSRAAPDGYTLLAGPTSAIVLLPQLRPQSYTPASFVPVAAIGDSIYAFGVLPTFGPKTLAEFLELAKKKPGQLTYVATGAPAAGNVLRVEVLKRMAGIDMQPVYYKGGLEAMADFMSGAVDLMNSNVMLPQARAGKVLLLCFVSEQRHPDFPDVPTLKELGYDPGITIWSGIFAPTGTPREIVEALGAAISEIKADPEVQRRLITIGSQALPWETRDLPAQMERDIASYAEWVRKLAPKME
jgi:tripartite-type tricarboxylate transporter receptor subunit TctC